MRPDMPKQHHKHHKMVSDYRKTDEPRKYHRHTPPHVLEIAYNLTELMVTSNQHQGTDILSLFEKAVRTVKAIGN